MAIAAFSGGVSGEVTLYGGPVAQVGVGAMINNVAGKLSNGEKIKFGELVGDTAVGAVTGALKVKVPGLNNNWKGIRFGDS